LYARLVAMTKAGHTVLLSSHTLGEVEALCDRVAILRRGRLVADESLEALRARARRAVTLVFKRGADAEAVSPPPFLTVHDRRDRQWRATLDSFSTDLVEWAAAQPLADITIGPPDLGRLFRQYYDGAPERS
jgi:ABC-2 type transport system ATP-binding protein